MFAHLLFDNLLQFSDFNGVKLIARAHQLVMDGVEWSQEREHRDIGASSGAACRSNALDFHTVTLFSAPNYCGRSGEPMHSQMI